MRTLKAEVAALKAAQAARPAPRKRAAAPRPSDAVVTGREKLWARFVLLHLQYGHGRMTLLRFATRHGVNPTELGRWKSLTAARGIPECSKPDLSHCRALAAAISELEARGENHSGNTRMNSHGKMLPSQVSGARPQ